MKSVLAAIGAAWLVLQLLAAMGVIDQYVCISTSGGCNQQRVLYTRLAL
ncbi:Uncharacterised protein [Pandoraea sputorum]|uniref:Uncharacterized protein n=1 Tax=Pandoraea sputorum TaxID=93222 RepID=A0A239SVY1_9BURK|nr:Uncharacterised protein [Pandoraea sputorum]